MALPRPNSTCRGVASAACQPANESSSNELRRIDDELRRTASARQYQLTYRVPTHNADVVWPVYRWDRRDPSVIFAEGFRPRPQGAGQTDADYYDLVWFVNNNRAPLNSSSGPRGSIFVSTTVTAPEISTVWVPSVRVPPARVPVESYEHVEVYRYEIYAPGGIDVRLSLGERLHPRFESQQEVVFAGGIRPQFIRSARLYSFTYHVEGSRFFWRVSNGSRHRNIAFNPNPDDSGWTPVSFLTELQRPICPGHHDHVGSFNPLRRHPRSTGEVEGDEAVVEDQSCKPRHYLQSAFNCNDTDEVYLFIGHRYLKINFAPGSTDDCIINGPKNIIDSFPSLTGTIFATGIEAAFNSSRKDEAYIFAGDQYALINFAPNSTNGCIIQHKKITESFYSLKGTLFADGIDAAFKSSRKDESYIFRGDQYALINFAPGTTDDKIIQGPKKITDSFHSLRDTRFANGIDAAFNSSRENEAYIFKGEFYALINYAPGTTNDKIIQQKKIIDSFYSLKDVLPMCLCSNDILDDVVEENTDGDEHHVHDEQ